MPKRRHGRVRAAGVTTRLRFGGMARIGHVVENLSLGGAFVRGAEGLPVGSKLTLELGHAGLDAPVRLHGRVVSLVRPGDGTPRHAPGLGIAFEPYPDDVLAQLRELLMVLAPGEALLDGDAANEPDFPRAATQPEFPRVAPPPPSRRSDLAERDAPVIVGTAITSQAESRLAAELVRAQKDLTAAAARVKWLENENEGLRDDLAKVRRALFQLRHR
jgi:hypothetical protein